MASVYVNGELCDEAEAKISIFDHGIIVGDGVFETLLFEKGRPFALARHFDRLEHSAHGLGLERIDRNELTEAIALVLGESGLERGRLRITLTSGTGPLGSARGQEAMSVIVAASKLDGLEASTSVAVVPWTRNEHGALAGLKTTSYAENARALAWAHEHDADEAIFGNTSGGLCEGTGTNVFVVKDGALLTPPLASGCLAGITRALVIQYAGGKEAEISIKDFLEGGFDEAFLTSSTRGVHPIATINGRAVRDALGPVTKEARSTYDVLVSRNDEP